jgi:hypothetical protein
MSAEPVLAGAFYIFFTIPIQPGNKLSETR